MQTSLVNYPTTMYCIPYSLRNIDSTQELEFGNFEFLNPDEAEEIHAKRQMFPSD